MALKPTQASRIGSFHSPLGTDKLVISHFAGDEGISELFKFKLEALSEEQNINFNPAIGETCHVEIKSYDGVKRYFSGVLVKTQWVGMQDIYFKYRLVLRPWLWMLSQVANCKIFAHQDIPGIIEDVLKAHPFAKYDRRLHGSYPELEYCVQYRETDLNFISRLMEEAGIYYFFEHSEDGHKLILADSLPAHKPKAGGSELLYRPPVTSSKHTKESLEHWTAGRQFSSGKVSLNDFDYKKPSATLLSKKSHSGGYQNADLEIYDYPGRFEETSVGENYAEIRLEAAQAVDFRCEGSGDAVTCCPGGLVDLKQHPESDQNRNYIIVRASHEFTADAYYAGGPRGAEEVYKGQYEFLPSDKHFRSKQVTRKPFIHGPQTAKVAGDGEIDVDKQGRIIVFFHWDKDREVKCARRVRISQIWAASNWGGIVIPRVGMEVIVEFLNGDPDQPLVTGTVYNGDHHPPYKLPDEKTVAGVKSQTEFGNGYNEFIFDDKKGKELVRLHGEKDLKITIENDETRTIKNDVTVKVGHNRDEDIGNSWKVEAGALIEFVVGASKITMTPSSILIQSPTITIKADGMLTATAPLTTVTGSATLTLTGGAVLIN